jgi:hypothetical protein
MIQAIFTTILLVLFIPALCASTMSLIYAFFGDLIEYRQQIQKARKGPMEDD